MDRMSFERQGIDLEDAFFQKEDQLLMTKLRELEKVQKSREELARLSGISDPGVLDRLMELGVDAVKVVALSAVPLLEVAWADGEVDDKERQAVLQAAVKMGMGPDSIEYALLERWLHLKHSDKLLTAWEHYVHSLSEDMSEENRLHFQQETLEFARAVAQASGGFLGLGNRISKSENQVLQRLERAFHI